jgi:hypothetical protein
MFTSADVYPSAFAFLGAPFPPSRAPLCPLWTPDLFSKIWVRLPQHLEVPCLGFFQIAQALHPTLLGAIEPVGAPPWPVIRIFFF